MSLEQPFQQINDADFSPAERTYVRTLLYGNGKPALNMRVGNTERDLYGDALRSSEGIVTKTAQHTLSIAELQKTVYGDPEHQAEGINLMVKKHEEMLKRLNWTLKVLGAIFTFLIGGGAIFFYRAMAALQSTGTP